VGTGGATSAAGADPVPLGTLTKFATPYATFDAALALANAEYTFGIHRFMLQSAARELLPDERVSICLRRVIPNEQVKVLHTPGKSCGHLGGLMVCGSVWMCALCSAKVSERRRIELSAGCSAWLTWGSIFLVTQTLQHNKSDSARVVVERLLDANRAMRAGKSWGNFKEAYMVAGMVRGLEMTYGPAGHHPHLHSLYFLHPGVDVAAFTADFSQRWQRAIASVGGMVSPRWGVDVRSANDEIASYLAKWNREPKWTVAHEAAKGISKNGRLAGKSLTQLLQLYAVDADRVAGATWRAGVLSLKGCHQLRYSPGLRAYLNLGKEKSDLELAMEQSSEAVLLATLSLREWRAVLANDARGELLAVAGSGDRDLVRSFVLGLPGASDKGFSNAA
jgi:hypothetical protein